MGNRQDNYEGAIFVKVPDRRIKTNVTEDTTAGSEQE